MSRPRGGGRPRSRPRGPDVAAPRRRAPEVPAGAPPGVDAFPQLCVDSGHPPRGGRRSSGRLASRTQLTTMPNGEAPAGSPVGEDANSLRRAPSTASPVTKPLLSTTHSDRPSGLRRASKGESPLAARSAVLPTRASAPPRSTRYVEMLDEPVFTVYR